MTLTHLNLVGHGDEIAAVKSVEREFGVAIDTTDAAAWVTVGNVFAALLRSIPDYDVGQPSTWRRFCRALAEESDDEPGQIAESTRLLMP